MYNGPNRSTLYLKKLKLTIHRGTYGEVQLNVLKYLMLKHNSEIRF